MARAIRWAVPLWSALLALLVCAPLLAPGYVLTYDMVWVPHLDVSRADLWGLGSALPRAVPSDAVAALLDTVLPAALVQKAVLVGAVFGSGLGMGVLLRSAPLTVRLTALTFYAWNPFVAERMALGQWPLLLAYAGVPWLLAGLRSDSGVRSPMVVVALAATALTPATGLMGALMAFLVKKPRESFFRLGVIIAAVNAPWIVAGLLHTANARSDGAAVALFDVQPEGNFGRLAAALTLGGIWNTEVVPPSRGMLIAQILAGLMWAIMIIGAWVLWREERRLLIVLSIAGVLGLAVALSGWLAPEAMASFVRDIPAAGLLRDGTRYLLLLAPLQAIAFGFGTKRLVDSVQSAETRQFLAVAGMLIPLAALPDLAWGVGGQLKTTDYPKSWYDARTAIASSKVPGDILVLPFSSYRKPSWNHDRSVLDPAGRFFDRETVTSDRLLISGKPIEGEDPRAARIERILGTKAPAKALAGEGIGIVVIDKMAGKAGTGLSGMKDVYNSDELQVRALANVAPRVIPDRDFYPMVVAWTIAFLALWSAATRAVLDLVKRRRGPARRGQV